MDVFTDRHLDRWMHRSMLVLKKKQSEMPEIDIDLIVCAYLSL